MSDCNCECLQIADINQCADTIEIDLGIYNAEKELEVYITGRSKRIYKLNINANLDGKISIVSTALPNGYFSIHTKAKYKISVEENGTPININSSGKSCVEFRAKSILEIIND